MTRRAMYLTIAAVVFGCAPNLEAETPTKQPASKDGPREVAILGAGCFWGVEHWMNKASGIVDIEVGYAGGKSRQVTYDEVSEGGTGHAEVVRIVFDPSVISYEDLLSKWFFKIHDPTTKDRQGNDVGSQYRSVIIPTTDAQKKTAVSVIARVEKSKAWKKPLSTTIEANTTWVKAEDYHQDYLVKNPSGYDNHYLRKLEF